MGVWHDHGAVDFSVFAECRHNSDVKLFDRRVDKTERLFYIKREQTFCALREEKGMTIGHFGIILIENN